MVGGIVSLVGGWVVEDRTADLADLTPALVEILFVAAVWRERRARRARRLGVGVAPGTAAQPADDELRLMDAFARAVVADGLAATRLADVAQREDIALDTVHALFDDELDCATQALDVWTGQLVAPPPAPTSPRRSTRRWPPIARSRRRLSTSPARPRSRRSPSPTTRRSSHCRKAARPLRALFLSSSAASCRPPTQRAPQPPRCWRSCSRGSSRSSRRFAQEERLAELPGELEALSLQSLTPFFGEAEAQRVAEQVAALR